MSPPTWPRFCAEPAQVLEWLGKLRPSDNVSKKVVVTLRWMVNEELERRMPEAVPTSITDFTPEEPGSNREINLLNDLTSGQQ